MKIIEQQLKDIKSVFESNFENIRKLKDNSENGFNKKLLWFTFLESIGNIFYSEKENGERFRKTINELSCYKYYNRIISPLFYLFLNSQNRKEYDKEMMDELLAFSWGDVLKDKNAASRIISAAQLPTFEELQRRAKVDPKTLQQFQLDNLLWLNRNMGIHARWQGDFPTCGGFDDISIVCDLDKGDKPRWRIYITVGLLEKLSREALNNFSTKNEIDYTYKKNDVLGKLLYDNYFYSI